MSIIDGGNPFDATDPIVTFYGGTPETDFDATGIFAMSPLKEFLPQVLPHAPKCPRPVAEQYLRQAAIEFCERTRLWRYIVNLTYDAHDKAILAPSFATIHEIRDAWMDGHRLEPVKFSDIAPWEFDTSSNAGPASRITQTVENSVVVVPYQEGTLRLTLIIKPRAGARYGDFPGDALQDFYNQVPQFIFDNHAETIAQGALARILLLPRQDYTDPAMAAYFHGQFQATLDALSTSGVSGQQRTRRRTKIQWL